MQEVGDTGEAFDAPALAVDGAGNAWLAWTHALRYSARIQGVRFVTALGTWTATTDLAPLPGPFEVTVESSPRLAIDAAGNTTLTYMWWKYNDTVWKATRWLATPPAPVVADVVPASGSLQVSATLASATDPALTVTGLEYSLDAGATWVAHSPGLTGFPLTISGLADGVTYAVRVRAVNVAGAGTASAVMPARSGTDVAPANLRIVSRTGTRVTLAWTPPAAGLLPTSYAIEGGLFGQSQVLATLPSGGPATQLTLDVPYGAYFVRVSSLWNGRRLGTSASLLFAVDANPEPSAPVGLLGSSAGSTLALSWRTTWEGAAPTGARLFVFGAITASLDLAMSESFVFPSVPPGTYTFAVSSTAGSRVGPPSALVTLTFPGACAGAPHPPAAFNASTQGRTVYLDWLPPSSGEAATSYVVTASGAFTGSFPISSRSFTSPVPPGSYTLSVQAVGPCGTSAPTAPQTVVVP
jgi:large repetitive protein